MPKRIGLLGGTFDPVHIGHLRVAEEALEALGLDSFLFIPAATPPHKPDRRIESFEDRFRMLQLAIEGNPRFELSDIEQRLPGKSYTVITLRELRKRYPPETELFFLVGLDAFWEVNTWYHYQELFELACIVVLRRPGYPAGNFVRFLQHVVSPLYSGVAGEDVFRHPSLCSVYAIRNTNLEVSSTRIRQLVAEGRSIRYLVPPEIMRYITTNELYQTRRAPEPDDEREREVHAQRGA